jgi:hypothetical protein
MKNQYAYGWKWNQSKDREATKKAIITALKESNP